MDIPTVMRSQGGLIARSQALAIGMSSSALSRRTASGAWRVLYPGVYLNDLIVETPTISVRAALLWLRHSAVVDGIWAAWLHGLVSAPDGPVTVTIPRSAVRVTAAHRGFGTRIRRRDLLPTEVTRRGGIAVTSRALTALECARHRSGHDIMDRALQAGTTVPSLSDTMDRIIGANGAKAARQALWRVRGGEVSEAERAYRRLIRQAGIRGLTAGVQLVIRGHELWLDFANEELQVAVEIDGWRVHSTGEAFHRDRWRQNLLEREFWTTLHYTPRQICEAGPAAVAETAEVLANAARRKSRVA